MYFFLLRKKVLNKLILKLKRKEGCQFKIIKINLKIFKKKLTQNLNNHRNGVNMPITLLYSNNSHNLLKGVFPSNK